MPLFQTSVLKKYLSQQDQTAAEKAYRKYSKYFLNTEIQENIRSSKEEQFQATFLTELFVNVFDYTINPSPKYNLTTEYKNEKNNRKADGAILNDATTLAVVELKGTNTKDLESIRRQAFDYKVNHKGCRYVITSNFEKLRFYIDDATAHESFDLFQLTPDRFALLYLCLYKDNLLTGVPFKIKQDSLVKEEQITKEFYNDYSLFKRELFRDLVKRNAKKIRIERQQELKEISTNLTYQQELQGLEKNVKLALFKRSQKLIDRFLFVFFAEDRGLLTPNSTLQILEKWKADMDFGDERPLYNLFKQYFNYLDTGRKGTSSRAEIYAYNGGLFQPDSILDGLEIDDNLLYRHTLKLAKYDFESQVDVNILGHIFENSLNEIESVNAEIEGVEFDKQKSKRKKDGVFYTPKYITKYIVENTVGKLCDEKKAELGFKEEEYFRGRKHRQKATVQKLVAVLDEYRDWLLQLTICDPACGSGAFLNQALDFLIKEHQYIDELKAKILGGGLQFPDIENTVLENNIYGVDINEESVEIAKLSLWLRTAQPRRKLNDLSNNIKCGNSLIHSKSIAGPKAFHWATAFAKIFVKGGFDVVIGNPPYVRQELLTAIKPYLQKNYTVFESSQDLFAYFYERAIEILKPKGLFGFISNTFDKTKAAFNLREQLKSKITLSHYTDFTQVQIFDGATTYPVIIIAENTLPLEDNRFKYTLIPKSLSGKIIDIDSVNHININQTDLNSKSWSFKSSDLTNILNKITDNPKINSVFEKSYRGIVTGYNDAFIIDKATKELLEKSHISSSEIIKPLLEGRDLNKWNNEDKQKYIIFTRRGVKINNYPAVKNYLLQFLERLTPRNTPDIKIGRKKGPYEWYEIQDSIDYYEKFETPKIVWPNLQSSNKFSFDEKNYYINAPSVILPNASLAILCILNSKLIWEFLKSICVIRSGGYIEVKPQYFEQIPIPNLKHEKIFEQKATEIISLTKMFQILNSKFQQYIFSTLTLVKISRKLENWQDLDFGAFIKELNKAIKATNKVREEEGQTPVASLTKTDEFEWLDLFEQNKKKAQDLQAQIEAIEQQIDAMVYELYGLTAEEIRIVEHE